LMKVMPADDMLAAAKKAETSARLFMAAPLLRYLNFDHGGTGGATPPAENRAPTARCGGF
jgi:hypothetical protein